MCYAETSQYEQQYKTDGEGAVSYMDCHLEERPVEQCDRKQRRQAEARRLSRGARKSQPSRTHPVHEGFASKFGELPMSLIRQPLDAGPT